MMYRKFVSMMMYRQIAGGVKSKTTFVCNETESIDDRTNIVIMKWADE